MHQIRFKKSRISTESFQNLTKLHHGLVLGIVYVRNKINDNVHINIHRQGRSSFSERASNRNTQNVLISTPQKPLGSNIKAFFIIKKN